MGASPDDDLTAAARARVGRTLRQKWRLDSLIGVGGMAAVYAATHRNGNRAAVKVLHEELAVVAEIKTRFLREAYVANKVQHPGSVRVIDDDTDDDGTTYLVMDLLEGETLAQRWERRGKRLFASEVCTMADAILDVLAAAHDKSIVHRDVKPENIFLTKDNKTKLLDFGFARVMDAAQQSSAMTGMRTTLGTPEFMPPEQAAGRWGDVDRRSDLWALGATMFTALSGQYVHEGRTLADVLIAAATKPARSLRVVAPHLPPGVVAVVERALAFDKPLRWADARAMQQAVREAAKTATAPSKAQTEEASSNDTTIGDDGPTIPRGARVTPPAVPVAKSAARAAASRPPPRPTAAATIPSAPSAPKRAASRPAPPEITVDEENVSETMLAVMVDTSGAPMAGVPRISDNGPPSIEPRPDEAAPTSRVIVETTPYATPMGRRAGSAPALPPSESVAEASSPTVVETAPPPEQAKLPRGFRQPGPSSPFWEQSPSGITASPSDIASLPPMRSQQATMPAIGGRAQVDRGGANRSALIIAGAAGFLFIVFAGMIAFLFLR